MAVAVKYVSSKSEAEILALISTDLLWFDQGFYYPNDTPVKPYYYRVVDGVMVKYSETETSSIGVTLNGKIIGGVKELIEYADILIIPENYEYNCVNLQIDGVIDCKGTINILN